MKKFMVLILCLVMILSLVACVETSAETETTGETETETTGENLIFRIKRVYRDLSIGEDILLSTNSARILVDSKTGVMYLFVENGYGGGLTVMVDENGDPLLWENEVPQ